MVGVETRSGLYVAVVVLLVGLAVSWTAADALVGVQSRTAGQLMDRRTALAQASVTTEVRRYLDALSTVAAGVGSHDRLTADTFQSLTAPLTNENLVGVASIGFVVPVPEGQVTTTQAHWRAAGAPDLTFQPKSQGEHLFAVFVRSLDGSQLATPGVDISQFPEPAAAYAQARLTGRPAVSDTYVLVRDRTLPAADQQLSFVLAAAVYPASGVPGGQTLRGWVVMGLRGQTFLTGTVSAVTEHQVNTELWATGGNDRQKRVGALRTVDRPDVYREATIGVADRQWVLRTDSSIGVLAGASRVLPTTVGLSGGAVSLLLAGLVWVLATGRARAQAQMVTATGDLRAAEHEARRQAGLLTAIMNSLGDGVGVVDETGAFLLHNPAAKRMLGTDQDPEGAENWQSHYGIFRPDGHTPFPADELPLVRAMAGEVTDNVEMIIRNADRPEGILISVQGRPLDVGPGQRGAVAVFRDITALREYENDLAAFAGVVAHDLKSPLTAVGAYAEVAADAIDQAEPEEARQALHRIEGGIQRMRRLIDDLLAYTTARDAAVRPATVDLQKVVADVIAERTDHLPTPDLRPDVYVGPLPYVEADPAMIRHVVDNLVGNALKYVQPGQRPRVDISATISADGWVDVEVADRGIGIPDEHKQQIFDTFHRAHAGAGYTGTGLGLAISRRIIDRHGGSIAVADNPGGGTRFRFTLPYADLPAPCGTSKELIAV